MASISEMSTAASSEAGKEASSCCNCLLPNCLAVLMEALCCKRPAICCGPSVCMTCCGRHVICQRDIEDKKDPEKSEPELLKRVKALYSFEAMEPQEISMQKGDILYIIDDDDDDWWRATHTVTQRTGLIPSAYVAEETDIDSEEWCFGEITRKESQKLLMKSGLERGTFMVRRSEKTGMYALSIRDEDPEHGPCVKHYQIRVQGNEEYYIVPKRPFPSLKELVAFYSGGKNGLCHRLVTPCPKPKPHMWDLSQKTKDNWEVERGDVQFIRKIGSGTFGEVWYGTWHRQIEIAVKTLKVGSMTTEQFLQEATIMKNLRHEKLVSLYAVCSEKEPIFIITEYMPYGSLLTYLRSASGQHLKLPILIDIAAQISNGMMYLEQQQLVHRDLAARNILVGDNNIVKISDFGLARILEDKIYNASEGMRMPIKWTAPEALTKRQFTVKSDIWSFGILLMEIITHGQIPYPAMSNTEAFDFISKGQRMPKPKDNSCPEALYEIMLECWAEDPQKRPSFEYLYHSLDEFLISAEQQYKHVD